MFLSAARARVDFASAILPRASSFGTLQGSGGSRNSSPVGTNLDRRYQVDPGMMAILATELREEQSARNPRPVLATLRRRPGLEEQARAVEVLERYLSPWRKRVAEQALGYLVALLGDGLNGSIRALAERLLGGESVDGVRETDSCSRTRVSRPVLRVRR